MYISKTNRRFLLDLIETRNPYKILNITPSNKTNFYDINQDDLIFVWFKRPTIGSFLPDLIVVSENKIRDFLAWSSTYIPSLTPFTSFCRVLTPPLTKMFLSSKKHYPLNRLEGACIGLILGETLTHFYNNNIKNINPLAIKSSLSFILIKSSIIGINEYSDFIVNRWLKACRLTKTDERVLSSERILEAWKILMSLDDAVYSKEIKLTDYQTIINKACNDILKNGSISNNLWLNLTNGIDELKNANEKMKESIENRVNNFEDVSNLLLNQTINNKVTEFLCGYLASQIEPGSMNHLDMIHSYIATFPSVILWYSICEGLYQNTKIHNYKNSLGWRVTRDLYLWLPDVGKPKSDISLDELEVIVDVDNPNLNFLVENPAAIFVEIVPSIYSVFIWRDQFKNKKTDQAKERVEQNPIAELGELLEKANKLYKRHFIK